MTGTTRLRLFPLNTVLFPGAVLNLHVFEERYRLMIASCLAGDHRFGVVLIARGSEVGGGDVRHDRGTMATIEVASPTPDGRYGVLARGGDRLRVHSWLDDAPYPRALVSIDTVDRLVAEKTGSWVSRNPSMHTITGMDSCSAIRNAWMCRSSAS